jgi:hypothetical protein
MEVDFGQEAKFSLTNTWKEGRSFVLYKKIVMGVDYFSALKLCT